MYRIDVHTSTFIMYMCTFFYFYHVQNRCTYFYSNPVQMYILLLLSCTGVHSSTFIIYKCTFFYFKSYTNIHILLRSTFIMYRCTRFSKKLRIRVYQTRLIIGFSRLRPFFKSYTISDSMSSMLGL